MSCHPGSLFEEVEGPPRIGIGETGDKGSRFSLNSGRTGEAPL